MTKSALSKVVNRLASNPRGILTPRSPSSSGNSCANLTEYRLPQSAGDLHNVGLLTPGHVTPSTPGQSLWMRASPETTFQKESLLTAIDNLKDDEDIKSELSLDNSDMTSSHARPRKIDTHAMVKGLMQSGFTLEQAESLTMTIVGVVDENTDGLRTSMVSKPQAELTIQKIAGQLAILRRDMMIMEKTDFTELVTKIERITQELQQLQRITKDEITKISSDMTLDFNLEKGKVKDMHLDHLKIVEGKHAIIFEKLTMIDKELQNVRSYINTENASLQTTFERYKSDTVKLAFGAVATCMTIVLGFYRLWL